MTTQFLPEAEDLAYFIRGNTVVIAAVAHGHRKPGYWRLRAEASSVDGRDTLR
jgi:hypothetical protein